MSARAPFNWTALVLEAKKRRAQEGLTQIAHANLARVSRETIRAFDRFEKTISIEKVLDILRVVGLVATGGDDLSGSRADFELRSLDRWRKLTQSLPKDDPATFPDGSYLFTYQLIGDLNPELQSKPGKWLDLLGRIPSVSGWSPFHVFNKDAFRPTIVDDELECWLGSVAARAEKVLQDAPHLDFWRVSPAGILFLLRAYLEDGADSQEPAAFLDVGLPIWRAGEIIDHALLLCHEIKKRNLGSIAQLRFDAWWTGLAGRQFVDWAAPTLPIARSRSYRCRLPEIRNAVDARESELRGNRNETLLSLVKPLYEAFGLKDIDQIEELIARRDQKRARWSSASQAPSA